MPSVRAILTSNGIQSHALKEVYRRLAGSSEQQVMWYIPTATYREGAPRSYVDSQVAKLRRDFGAQIHVVDVEYIRGASLRRLITDLKPTVIYAEGGNTYNLRHHLRASGADQLIQELLDAGALYVGVSAGSIVAGRTVQTAFWKDWDDRTAQGTLSVDWEDSEQARGLNILGGRSVFPHANGSFADAAWQDEQARKHGHDDHEVIRLADGDALVLEGSRAEVYREDGDCWMPCLRKPNVFTTALASRRPSTDEGLLAPAAQAALLLPSASCDFSSLSLPSTAASSPVSSPAPSTPPSPGLAKLFDKPQVAPRTATNIFRSPLAHSTQICAAMS